MELSIDLERMYLDLGKATKMYHETRDTDTALIQHYAQRIERLRGAIDVVRTYATVTLAPEGA